MLLGSQLHAQSYRPLSLGRSPLFHCFDFCQTWLCPWRGPKVPGVQVILGCTLGLLLAKPVPAPAPFGRDETSNSCVEGFLVHPPHSGAGLQQEPAGQDSLAGQCSLSPQKITFPGPLEVSLSPSSPFWGSF